MLFLCLYKQFQGEHEDSIKSFFVYDYEEYNSFVTNNASNILWAKMIDSLSGEVFDSFTNLNYISLSDFSVNIPEEDRHHFMDSCICLKREFKNLISFAGQHNLSVYKKMTNQAIPYIEIRKEDNQENFIPDDIIILNQRAINSIISEIKFSLDEEKLKEFKRLEPNLITLSKAI